MTCLSGKLLENQGELVTVEVLDHRLAPVVSDQCHETTDNKNSQNLNFRQTLRVRHEGESLCFAKVLQYLRQKVKTQDLKNVGLYKVYSMRCGLLPTPGQPSTDSSAGANPVDL